METYIIRIYRYERDNPRKLVGLVEEVGSEGNSGFTDLDGLWNILNPARKNRGKPVGREQGEPGEQTAE